MGVAIVKRAKLKGNRDAFSGRGKFGFFAFIYNLAGAPVAAGILLSPMFASAAMALSSGKKAWTMDLLMGHLSQKFHWDRS